MKTKKSAIMASASVLAAGAAHGAIVYSGTINQTITSVNYYGNPYEFDLNKDGFYDYQVFFDSAGNPGNTQKPCIHNIAGSPMPYVLSQTNQGTPVIPFGTLIGSHFTVGTNVLSMSTIDTNGTSRAYLYEEYDNNTVVGEWPPNQNTSGYVGLAMVDTNLDTTNFGWLHLSYNAADPNNTTMTVIDYAYETTSGSNIVAGATVEPAYPVIYNSPTNRSVEGGATVQMTVQALGDPPPTYQWMAGTVGSGVYTNLVDGGNVSGSTTPTLTITNTSFENQLDYVVAVKNDWGSVTSSPPATLTVIPASVTGPIPAQQIIYAGWPARFRISVASGTTNNSFQWQKDAVDLSDGGNISGSSTTNLQFAAVGTQDIASYDAFVTNVYGSVTSSVASLNIVYPDGTLYESKVLATSPVDYYRLNETGGPIAYDYVGGDNGIYGGDVQRGIAGPTSADGYPGFASTNNAAGFYLSDVNSQLPLAPWNLNTNTVTFTAWINPQGPQVSNAGIVFTRGTNDMVNGIFYGGTQNPDTSDYYLGYDWNDQIGAWNWNSGISVPQYQWSLVALVVTPTNATLYVINTNGVTSAVNDVPNVVQSFNTAEYIGTDPGGANGGRNFNGYIDEVAVFNKSLTEGQILNLYAASIGHAGIAPKITLQPLPQQLFTNQTAHLISAATGSDPLSYQWWMAGSDGVYTNLLDGANISGATTPALTIRHVTGANIGNYFLVVTNVAGVVTSSIVPVNIVTSSTGLYENSILAAGAEAFYELNETDDPAISNVIAYDHVGGFDGVYGDTVQDGNARYNIAGPRPADGFPGFSETNTAALFTNGASNSQVTVPTLSLTTNMLTVTAWIKPSSGPGNSGQQPFAGIVFSRGNGSGSGMDYIASGTNSDGATNCCLGYQWNADINTYTWVSGIVPPTDQWSFVSLVITPTNAIVYMMNTNGMESATNSYANPLPNFVAPVTIGNDALSDDGIYGFNGVIDNVALFNSALNGNQLRVIYNTGLNISPPVKLSITPVGSNLRLDWSGGVLLESTNVTGPWSTNSTAVSPYMVTPTNSQEFFRVQ